MVALARWAGSYSANEICRSPPYDSFHRRIFVIDWLSARASSRNLQTQPINKPVPMNDCRHKPWVAGIQRPAVKRQVIESRGTLSVVKHLVSQLVPKKR